MAFQGARLTVETRRLATDALQLRVGALFQFLGETYRSTAAVRGPVGGWRRRWTRTPHAGCGQDGRGEVRLVARVARNVDGLDVDLFLEALALRRRFLASR